MSFRSTREALCALREHVNRFKDWCARLTVPPDATDFLAAKKLVLEELEARALGFQKALETADPNCLDTFLQFEPTQKLRIESERITNGTPGSAESLFSVVSDFYHIVFEGLMECQTAAESTPAAALFAELEAEAQAGISSLGWKLRQQ